MPPESADVSNNQVESYLQDITKQDDELESLRGSYMASCKGPRSRIRDIKDDARESGLNMVAFNAVLKDHRAERKRLKRVAEMESDDAADYETLREKLGEFGDTPLGQAALDAAPKKGRGRSKEQALDSLRP